MGASDGVIPVEPLPNLVQLESLESAASVQKKNDDQTATKKVLRPVRKTKKYAKKKRKVKKEKEEKESVLLTTRHPIVNNDTFKVLFAGEWHLCIYCNTTYMCPAYRWKELSAPGTDLCDCGGKPDGTFIDDQCASRMINIMRGCGDLAWTFSDLICDADTPDPIDPEEALSVMGFKEEEEEEEDVDIAGIHV